MKAFVITIRDHEYSESCADRCVVSANSHNIEVEKFYGVNKHNAYVYLDDYQLSWGWADNNTKERICNHTGLQQFPYTTNDLRSKIACSLSHFLLWKKCVDLNESILILEHDAVFIRELPEINFYGAIQINDPNKGGYRGKWHSNFMIKRGTTGVHPLTRKREEASLIPDGFSGASAYIIKPRAAKEFINAFHKYGVWPNDATICLQLFPWLEEYYPFITQVQQTQSTSKQ